MKRDIFLLLFFFPVVLYAQDNSEMLKISGLVLDKKNNEPLAFVNIGIINRNIGTISYENGSFELAIPVQHANDELTFSMVGYKVLTIPINDIIGNTKNFDKFSQHIPSFNDALAVEKGYIAMSNSEAHLKIKCDEDTGADNLSAFTELVKHWADKYKLELKQVDNKNTYYIIGQK